MSKVGLSASFEYIMSLRSYFLILSVLGLSLGEPALKE